MADLSFLRQSPKGTARLLELLAVPESLTDAVAAEIDELAPLPSVSAEDFLLILRYTNLIEPRNSEWNIVPAVRDELRNLSEADPELLSNAHRVMLRYSTDDFRDGAGSEVPSYLFTEGGKAFHRAGIGDIEAGISHSMPGLTSKYAR